MESLLALVLGVALVGCSSEATTGTMPGPSTEDEPGELVSYEAIAGTWSGWDYTTEFAFRVEIDEEAHQGEAVGDFNVLRVRDIGLVAYCTILMKAESADPPTYLFDGYDGTCTPTTLTFHHDPDEQRIELHNDHDEHGYLIRGDDPGPPPE